MFLLFGVFIKKEETTTRSQKITWHSTPSRTPTKASCGAETLSPDTDFGLTAVLSLITTALTQDRHRAVRMHIFGIQMFLGIR